MFKIRRIGTDVLIVSNKHAEEMRTLSKDVNRSIEPFTKDFAGEYVEGMVFLESDLQNRVVQQRLTPSLGALTSVMKNELDSAIQIEIPHFQEGRSGSFIGTQCRSLTDVVHRHMGQS
jgi:ent-kaurene oxidase